MNATSRGWFKLFSAATCAFSISVYIVVEGGAISLSLSLSILSILSLCMFIYFSGFSSLMAELLLGEAYPVKHATDKNISFLGGYKSMLTSM